MFHDDHQHFAGLTWASNSRAKRPNGSRVAPRSTTLQGLAIGTVYLVYLTMSIFYLGCASAATPAPSFAPIPAPTAVPSLAPTNWTVPPTHSTAAPTPAPLPVPTLAPSSSTTNTTAEMTNTTSTTRLCNVKCSAYYAGASASDPLVCKYKASGVATVQESREEGVACFPAYNCGSDWTVCVNNEEAMDVRKEDGGSDDITNVCNELATLEKGGYGGNDPPSGGYKPSPLGGWMKSTGELGCGWGAGFWSVRPTELGAEDEALKSSRHQYTGVTSDFDCCVKAMQHENNTRDAGGAAVRFGLNEGTCTVDLEKSMTGKMDSSSGFSANNLNLCGHENSTYYWRHANGNADASNLKGGGQCAASNGFTRLEDTRGASIPSGRLPDGLEWPNHNCGAKTGSSDGNSCDKRIRYNTISSVEECCEACQSLQWFDLDTFNGGTNYYQSSTDVNGSYNNPCVGFQIVAGKCRIMRANYTEYFWPHKTVAEVVESCADDHSCPTAEDGTYESGDGYWGDCDESDDDGWGSNCGYFSSIFYREYKKSVGTTVLLNESAKYSRLVETTTSNVTCDVPSAEFVVFEATIEHYGVDTRSESERLAQMAFVITHEEANATSTTSVDCAALELIPSSAISDAFDVVEYDQGVDALCTSECSKEDGVIRLVCNASILCAENDDRRRRQRHRRLGASNNNNDDEVGTAMNFYVSMTSVGSGQDSVDFTYEQSYEKTETIVAGDDGEDGVDDVDDNGVTPVPTPQPTSLPTPQLSPMPTPQPTTVSTLQPSALPSPQPTAVPTYQPNGDDGDDDDEDNTLINVSFSVSGILAVAVIVANVAKMRQHTPTDTGNGKDAFEGKGQPVEETQNPMTPKVPAEQPPLLFVPRQTSDLGNTL
eukprot:CAMPEP_0182567918 /NCGR_PEP_ID=MMETSP1324-20130603/9011_1 /TAXON_ID=236786 /ORGANISM="Florenciella sp., Strain RCC1587" /LENGTH=881 /DNA_ID=CAMNT_0024781999 /DNA_START=50 /DNA_END=2695 /DNA_ORIENTATION=+